jgi:hypothetical protein
MLCAYIVHGLCIEKIELFQTFAGQEPGAAARRVFRDSVPAIFVGEPIGRRPYQ